jgi:hypothetical protein
MITGVSYLQHGAGPSAEIISFDIFEKNFLVPDLLDLVYHVHPHLFPFFLLSYLFPFVAHVFIFFKYDSFCGAATYLSLIFFFSRYPLLSLSFSFSLSLFLSHQVISLPEPNHLIKFIYKMEIYIVL